MGRGGGGEEGDYSLKRLTVVVHHAVCQHRVLRCFPPVARQRSKPVVIRPARPIPTLETTILW